MDSNFIRRQFSSLQNDWILFENAGGTQVPDQVIHRVSEFYRTSNFQPDYNFSKSKDCGKIVAEARQFVADWIGASSPELVAFGPSATALNRIAAVSLSQKWQAGDEIIVTISDHEANVTPWKYLEHFGLSVKFWNVNRETFELQLEDLEKMITDRTVLVAFPHISNILGMENPVREITQFVHKAGARVYVDGVASTPHTVVDVEEWDIDFFVFSTYKTFGPHAAALYVERDLFEELKSVNHFFLKNKIPRKFELGTPNLEGCAAIVGIKDYFSTIIGSEPGSLNRAVLTSFMEDIHAYEHQLARYLIDGLKQNPRVQIIGSSNSTHSKNRVPVVSFTVKGVDPEFIHKNLGEQKIAVGVGHFYAYRLIDFLGLMEQGGVIRASLVHYNTSEEIDCFLRELDKFI